ncbi:YbhB/YbcL family Raf kinase inhibitor-like protein [Trinickia caryophylli]|uniref:Phospholipid-binding protein, PBP family n=1 Tax=Trinickia caryophylli TaxID=28094 RepID=A0A1X7FKP2_TRICW|nr:YbhB/YbcL family Raf kinase inhibitor-like protein [Trinickia caryophylli]PMS13338.1 YbhB/YbcL family Raf kinase inhibitor-like protein [Trinickia caryophylli]TRX19331.1 YbhB/YbcL family Raf kinase inhibitor-like protein [Trinickia caryophylli]WQE13367.1 YbhB/YbcL family Raf kinase inhibitor-like protein [Trinickia caryophylli]SMF53863.1 phospholipid-binding protein, PBP family [Trinickia caryophylli]GLU34117.1 phosphatidylethanolamine-binding protein [Trinickia caryophylli]
MPRPCSVAVSVWYSLRRRLGAALIALATAGLAASPASSQAQFRLTSKDLSPDKPVQSAQVYDKEGCRGQNRSPQLQWSGAPAATKSFAVTVYDLDAPGRGWWHWVVASIPKNVTSLPENASASGYLKSIHAMEARNDYDAPGYGGPCPPSGKPHRYVVTVYALGTNDLRLAPGRPALMFDHEINTTALAKASITVTYGR